MGDKVRWTNIHTITLTVIVIVIGCVGYFSAGSSTRPSWALSLILLLAFVVIAGQGVTGRWSGALIDARNKMSLARFQMIAWTIVVLSAYLTVALARMAAGVDDALAVAVPTELWLLMGISTTSLVGSPLLLGAKRVETPDDDEKDESFGILSSTDTFGKDELDSSGTLATKKKVEDARVSDMFKGDETGNCAHLDMAKVQMFFFTIILLVAYIGFLAKELAAASGTIESLPVIPEGMIALLGISHAGFLGNKAISHSKKKP